MMMKIGDTLNFTWKLPVGLPALAKDEVHVWRAQLDGSPMRVQELLSTLAPDERERAGRFHFTKDRDRFIVARGTLRSLLGLYLDREPGRLRFGYNPYGKPHLMEERHQDDLNFNLSH